MSTNTPTRRPTTNRGTGRTGGTRRKSTSNQNEIRDPSEYLDSLTLLRKEGWRAMVNATRPEQPELLSARAIRQLNDDAAATYNRARARWHADTGFINTAVSRSVVAEFNEAINGNCQRKENGEPILALSGLPALGKSTAVRHFGAEFHRQEIAEYGPTTPSGDERWPVCRVGLSGGTGLKEFNGAVCNFYAHPGRRSGSADQILDYALDCILSCQTHLLIVDDVHFLHGRSHADDLSNQFKHIAENFPVTVVLIGIGLHERNALLDDTGKYIDHDMEQLLRSSKPIDMSPFSIRTNAERVEWRRLLRTLEQRLVLANKYEGMLAEGLSDYLYIRSTGHIGSLMHLLRLGCQKAIGTGREKLTVELLDACRIDSAAELGRRELEVAFRTGKKTTKVSRR